MKHRKLFIVLATTMGILLSGFIFALFYLSFDSSFRKIEAKNGLIILHHPGRYNQPLDWYMDQFDKYNDTIVGMEVHNQGNRYPEDAERWDALNKMRTPYNYIWGFANDDWHGPSHSFRCYQRFPLEVLTEANLKTAMQTGAFYFSYEPQGANSSSPTYRQAATPRLIAVTTTGNNITIIGENYETILWYDDNTTVIASGYSFNVSLTSSSFVRAVLNNTHGLTYTQPFGLYQSMIFNPYTSVDWTAATHFKANFHTHTSDYAPAWVIDHYHSANYSILAITDHNANTWPWSEEIDSSPTTPSLSSEYYPDLGMLAVSGNEASNSHHFSSLFNDFNGDATDLRWQLSNL